MGSEQGLTPDTRTPGPEGPVLHGARSSLFQWAQAVSSGQIENILSLYAVDAVLVPTLVNDIAIQREEHRRYFEFLLSNGRVTCTINSHRARINHKLGNIIIGGLYTFNFSRDTGKETVDARYLFTFEEIESRWLITGHHSSRAV